MVICKTFICWKSIVERIDGESRNIKSDGDKWSVKKLNNL